MIRSCLFAVLCCATALGQLPPPQAPPPHEELRPRTRTKTKGAIPAEKTQWRVDAVVTGPDGKAVPDLTAADFEISTNGKPRTRTALHAFIRGLMRPGDEAAVLATSASDGKTDQFTADKTALDASIDRLQSNRLANDSPAAFGAGSIAALRSAVLGLQFTPGRKLAVFLSERLRDAN